MKRTLLLTCLFVFCLRASNWGQLKAQKQENGASLESLRLSEQFAEATVSVTRLHAPPKAVELYQQARKAFGKHQYEKAERRLDGALRLYDEFPEALTMSGYIHVCNGQVELAEQSLRAALRADPSFGLAQIVLADLYNTQERFDSALDSASRAAGLISNSWITQFEIARALLGKGDYESSLRISDAALQTNPGTLLRILKAHALIGLQRYPEAATELRTYLQYQPTGDLSQHARDLLNKLQTPSVAGALRP